MIYSDFARQGEVDVAYLAMLLLSHWLRDRPQDSSRIQKCQFECQRIGGAATGRA